MIIRPFKTELTFNKKKFIIFIKINDLESEEEYHYDIEIRVKERITGDEFQKLKKYLEDEGYIDSAIEYYKKYF